MIAARVAGVMPDRAALARRDGADAPPPTPALAALLDRLGVDVVARATQSRPEHGRYGVGPDLVERLRAPCRDRDADTVVVDGHLHEGQVVDLVDALPVATVWDRRDAVWAGLAAGDNAVAATRRDLRAARLARRRAAAARRDGPGADDGRLADLDRRRDRLEATLAEDRATARRTTLDAYTEADAHVAVVGPVDAPTSPVWAALCDRPAATAATGPLVPATVTTAVTRLGAHDVAAAHGPGLLDGDAAWYDATVPDWTAAVERATLLVVAADGSRAEAVGRAACDRADAPVVAVTAGQTVFEEGPSTRVAATVARGVDVPLADRLRAAVADALPTTRLVVTLPYADEAHAVVSWLHDDGAVAGVDYGDRITVRVAVPAAATTRVRSRVTSAGGTVATRPDATSS